MKLIIPVLAGLLLAGCFSKEEEQEVTDTVPAVSKDEVPASKGDTASLSFPVFMTYESFSPLLNRANDTTYVLNFWATWCKPCIAEMPYFERLIREKKDEPVEVLLVSMDFPKQIKSKLIPFVAERGIEEHVVALADMDYNAWIDKVSSEWDGAIPFTLIYKGEKRAFKLGELEDYHELEGLLNGIADN